MGPDRDLNNKSNIGCESCITVICFVFWEKGQTDKRAEPEMLEALYWKLEIRGNEEKWEAIYHVVWSHH